MKTAAVVIFLIGALSQPIAASASAPAGAEALRNAEPGIDAVVVEAPEAVRLSFAEDLVPDTAVVRLYASTGEEISVAAARVDGRTIDARLEPLDDDHYLVAWEVEGTATGALSGGHFFTVDRSGLATVAVEREIEGASGTLQAARVIASVIAFLGGVVLLAAFVVGAVASGGASLVAPAATVTGISAAVAFVAWAIPAGGSGVDLLETGSWRAAVAHTAGRAWLAVLAAMAGVPLLALIRSEDPEAAQRPGWRLGVAVIGLVTVAGIAIGTGAVTRVGAGVIALAFVVAAGGTAAWLLDQRLVALFAAAGVATVVFVGFFVTRPVGHSATLEAGELALEVDVEPARRGINELHLYGFRLGGGLATLTESQAWMTHLQSDAGPIEVPLLRAGPNHFLTYTADLPLAGEWRLEFSTEAEDGATAEVDTIVSIR